MFPTPKPCITYPPLPAERWDNFIHEQRYQDCQVVAAINARAFLTDKQIRTTDRAYEELVDIAKARDGAAIDMEPVFARLGIEPYLYFRTTFEWRMAGCPLPIDISVWHMKYGYHMALGVEYAKRCDALRVVNLKYHTNAYGWIFRDDLDMLVKAGQQPLPPEEYAEVADRFAHKIAKPKNEHACTVSLRAYRVVPSLPLDTPTPDC